MTAKMIGRHPHVFGSVEAQAELNIQSADDVMAVWDDLKATEKPSRTSVLDGIPQGMPALALADKLLGRAHKVGHTPALATDCPTTEDELGAHLLAIVASAKENGLDSERALRGALRKLQREIREREKTATAEA
jgi:XTP/dITP diphosphohydrolase